MRETMKCGGSLLVALLLCGCATGNTAEGRTTSNGSENSSSGSAGGGGNGGNGGNAGSGGSGGSGIPRKDAIPQNGVGFFQIPACPTGWEPFKAAAGRAILPTIGTAPGGATVGDPLTSGEERQHTHQVKATFDLIDISYAGIASGGNSGVAKSGAVAFTTTSDAASTGLPYVQLLACKKMVAPEPSVKPLPAGMQIYYDGATCPSGWKQAPTTQGRFVIGTPKGAPADISFGGEPIASSLPRTHTHANDAALTTTPHGIALAAGCCGSGYAKNTSYSNSEDTGEGDAALPWIELLHCEKL
jgi:hypothetical protein